MAPFLTMTSPEIFPLEEINGIPPVTHLTTTTGHLNPYYLEALMNKAMKAPTSLSPAEVALIKQLAEMEG